MIFLKNTILLMILFLWNLFVQRSYLRSLFCGTCGFVRDMYLDIIMWKELRITTKFYLSYLQIKKQLKIFHWTFKNIWSSPGRFDCIKFDRLGTLFHFISEIEHNLITWHCLLAIMTTKGDKFEVMGFVIQPESVDIRNI